MNRHYYISDNLDELESVEHELEAKGISTEQIHVLSDNEAAVEQHQLPKVASFLKQDIVHSSEIGAAIGVVLAALLLGAAYGMGWTETAAGWVPFAFLAVVLLGFCTWEGGFLGLQEPNTHFRRFKRLLKRGKHVFFVDVEPNQEEILDQVVKQHPRLKVAGTGDGAPHWVITWLQKWHQFKRAI
uniref:NAD/FAD-utilizing enzyme apparently involved in cell division n=1 Tax=Marinobacterium profundum TaxID=1714300 RepID=UPI000830A6C4|nr:NAD/FAD-utilizing enzyme apparently involved in cell division [Marinobacterium profundum]